jgi:hypothetical protein
MRADHLVELLVHRLDHGDGPFIERHDRRQRVRGTVRPRCRYGRREDLHGDPGRVHVGDPLFDAREQLGPQGLREIGHALHDIGPVDVLFDPDDTHHVLLFPGKSGRLGQRSDPC